MKWRVSRKLTDRQKLDICQALGAQITACQRQYEFAVTDADREEWSDARERYMDAYRALFTVRDRRALDQRDFPVPAGAARWPSGDPRRSPRHDRTRRQRDTR
jgi:hypothetical protein